MVMMGGYLIIWVCFYGNKVYKCYFVENDHSNENKRPLLCKTSTKTFKDSDFIKLKESINHHELKQKANEDEKRVFVENFYRLLITARSQISKLEEKNKELTDKQV
jgi:hypothetical protein